MSIEKALADLTIAVKENTEIHSKVLVALGKAATATTTAKATTTPKATTPPKTTKAAPTEALMREAFGGWIAEKGIDTDEKTRRKNLVMEISAHFSADRVTNIPESDRQEALDTLEGLKAGTYPDYIADPNTGGEDDDVV